MAVLCRVPTLEETIVQVCVEVCTCCPTLNAVQVAGCGTAFLVVLGTLLAPLPVATGSATNSLIRERSSDFPLRKKKTKTTITPKYTSLRAPVVGSKRIVASSRGETHAHLVTRAMLGGKASDESSMHMLVETPRIGQLRAVGVPGEHKQILMGLLALVLMGKIVHKVFGRIGVAIKTRSSKAKILKLEENRAKLERIFHTGHELSQNLGGGDSTRSVLTYAKLDSELTSL